MATSGTPMTMSGFCLYPSNPEHYGCHLEGCTCPCHQTKPKGES